MIKLFTIGYTKKSLEEFSKLLKKNDIQLLIDIRLKNSSQLAGFAKAKDLKFILEEFLHIKYIHLPELSPTEEIFKKYKSDNNWEDYVESFNELMKRRQMDKILKNTIGDFQRICLLCSEDLPKKCHRRLVAEFFKNNNNDVEILHLTKKDAKDF